MDRKGPVFVVTHTWPEIRNAEYEVLQRLAAAASNVGATMIAVDNDGRPLWCNRLVALDVSKPLDPSEIDFMISLHFESPRLVDVYSYYALWQPLDFYFQFGYEASLQKMLSHSDCLSCLSDVADAHGRATFGARGPARPQPFPTLFHNVPQPYLEPRIDAQSRLFYIGVNWEKGGRPKGRHAGVLELLDGDGVLDIYGPRKLLNFEPWEGFDSYRGELPFDGLSTVKAINQAGICLALSSEAHKRAGLMSNRLFEGLAGGAAVIVDSNRFAQTHFADVAYFVDDRGSEEDVAFQIKMIVEQIRRDPDAAIERVRRGQALLAEKFSLEGSLSDLIETHPKRVAAYREATLAGGSVSVIVTYHGVAVDELQAMLEQVAQQILVSTKVVLICDAVFWASHGPGVMESVGGSIGEITPILLNLARFERVIGQPPMQTSSTGPAIAEALSKLDTDYFAFLGIDDLWFHDHLASMAGALSRKPDAVLAVSGSIEQSADMVKTSRSLSELRFVNRDLDLLTGRYGDEFGRFLFRGSVAQEVSPDGLALLDGQEPNLVRLAGALHGEPAQTGYATYVHEKAKAETLPGSVVPQEQQQQFIRDCFAFDARWQSRMKAVSAMPTHLYAYSPGCAVRFDRFQQPLGVARHLPVGALLETNRGGEGLKYLEHGFSSPENEGTWIEADFGAIEFFCSEQTWAVAQDYDLVLYMRGRDELDTGRPQHGTIVVNGVAIAYVELPDQNRRFAFRLPRNAFSRDGRLRVQLIPDHAEMVYGDQDQVIDGRRLSIHVQRFGLIPRIDRVRPLFVVGKTYEFTPGDAAMNALSDGLAYPEDDGVVLLGRAAHLSFQIGDVVGPIRLALWMTDRSGGSVKASQHVKVSLNGKMRAAARLLDPQTKVEIELDVPDIDPEGVCALTLEFDCATVDTRPPKDHRPALLAAQLHRLEVVDVQLTSRPPPPPPLLFRIKRRLKLALTGRPQ